MTHLTIVTSCFNYGQYLNDWARSLIGLKTHPDAVVIVNNGSTDNTEELANAAGRLIEEAGIPCIVEHIEKTDFGSARNKAVSLSATEWVQHLDCDDQALPHMVDDFLEIAPQADIVAIGYERFGDLASGPRQRVKLYQSSQGPTTLSNPTPCSGVSPFRRSFWEKSPYRTDMKGGWDTALWLGFAHLNARVVPTTRPCFLYRQHADSVFNTRRLNSMKTQEVGTKLQSLRRGDVGQSIIVPFRSDGDWRERVWQWVKKRYEAELPGWDIVMGEYQGDSWNKGRAVNAAVAQSTGRVLIIADADCIIDPAALKVAAQLVEDGKPWVMPHRKVHRLNESSTTDVISQSIDEEIPWEKLSLDRSPYDAYPGGGLIVIERAKFDFVQGFPIEFNGWGAEDEAFAVILDTMLGDHVRLEYDLWHLWHPRGHRARSPEYQLNRRACARYEAMRDKPEEMWHYLVNRETDYRAKGLDVFPYRRYEPNPATVITSGVLTGYKLPLTRMDISRIQSESRTRTLQIREEQRRRNEDIRQAKSFEQQRLAMAGQRLKGSMNTTTKENDHGRRTGPEAGDDSHSTPAGRTKPDRARGAEQPTPEAGRSSDSIGE